MKLEHWQEYLIEAIALGFLMVCIGIYATILESPASPVREAIASPLLRRVCMGICICFTLIGIIYSPWGKKSGAHTNPAFSLALFRLRKMTAKDAAFYAIAQFIGGTLGVFLGSRLLGEFYTNPPIQYTVTIPNSWGWPLSFIVELGLSFGLILMVLFLMNTPRFYAQVGIFVGILVAIYIVVAAPITGMSINPARTFASAFPAGIWTDIWVYFLAPPLGMLLGAELYLYLSCRRLKNICVKYCKETPTRCIKSKHEIV